MPLAEPRKPADSYRLTIFLSNLGDSADVKTMAVPEAGYVREFGIHRDGSGGSLAGVFTLTTADGAIGSTVTVTASGGGFGDIDSTLVSKDDANAYVAAHSGITISNDGGLGGTPSGRAYVVIERY